MQDNAPTSQPAPESLDQAWLASNIGYLSTRVSAKIKRAFTAHSAAVDLTPVEFSIVAVLASNRDVNQKQLCQALDLSPSSLAVILDRLVKRRLARRVRGTEDRRETFVHATPAALSLYERGTQIAMSVDREAGSMLTDVERMILVELLRKVARLQPSVS